MMFATTLFATETLDPGNAMFIHTERYNMIYNAPNHKIGYYIKIALQIMWYENEMFSNNSTLH